MPQLDDILDNSNVIKKLITSKLRAYNLKLDMVYLKLCNDNGKTMTGCRDWIVYGVSMLYVDYVEAF